MAHVLVIGAGPGGYVAAIRLAQRGQQVTVVEADTLGGVCLNWGCIPSKAMIYATGLLDQLKTGASTMGLLADNPRMDMEKLQAWKRGIIQRLTGGIGQLFKSHGITHLPGRARFLDARRVAVELTAGGEQVLTPDFIIVATGSVPVPIPGFAVDGQRILDSKDALDLTQIPEKLMVLGGGVIGLELGSMLARLGSQVTVVEREAALLPGTDPELVSVLSRQLKKRGLRLLTQTSALGADIQPDGVQVRVKTGEKEDTLTVDQVLVAVGRRPNTAGLGLEHAGIQLDKRGFIPVDGQLRTTVPHLFAIGDVCRPPLLAHKASREGVFVAEVIAGGANLTWDVQAMPAAVFTEPEIATVGLSEADAQAAGRTVRVGKFPFAASGRALSMQATEGFVKIVADAETDRVLGVHMVGPHVADLLGEATLAIEAGLTSQDLALTVHTHPTLPETLMEAAEAVHGHAIHIYQKPLAEGTAPAGKPAAPKAPAVPAR